MKDAQDQARVTLYNAACKYSTFVNLEAHDFDEAMRISDDLETAAIEFAGVAGDREPVATQKTGVSALCSKDVLGGGDAPDFISELRDIINRHSMENGSNTPDFILAQYLANCLRAWNSATTARTKWYAPPEPQCEPPNAQDEPRR